MFDDQEKTANQQQNGICTKVKLFSERRINEEFFHHQNDPEEDENRWEWEVVINIKRSRFNQYTLLIQQQSNQTVKHKWTQDVCEVSRNW